MPNEQLLILHEDPLFVIVNKPSGVLSVPGLGEANQHCITRMVRDAYPQCIEQPSVHRLDMDTSGLMVVALTKESHRTLSIQFQNREPKKRYVALLEGELHEPSGRIELPFRLDIDNRPIQIYDEVHGKIGITRWENLGIENGRTRVAFFPETGRTHQLRVHAAHEKGLGIPIVGDPFYGTGTAPGQLKLHAYNLSFEHPETKESLSFESEAPF